MVEDGKVSPMSRGDVKLRVERRGRDAALRRGSDAPFTKLRANLRSPAQLPDSGVTSTRWLALPTFYGRQVVLQFELVLFFVRTYPEPVVMAVSLASQGTVTDRSRR